MLARDIDHALGAPLLWGLGRLGSKRRLPERTERIGLLKTRAISDAILATALTKAIRRRWPDGHLFFFADESTRPVVPMLPAVEEVIEVSWPQPWKTVCTLGRPGLDLLFDLGSWPLIDALLAAAAAARFCVGFETPGQQRHYAHDFAVRHRGDVLEVEISASLEAVAPDAVVDQLPSLRRAQASEETPGRLRLNFPRLFVVFHPFAGGSNPGPSEWLAENWLELGRLVLGEGLLVVVSDGPAHAEPATRLRDRMLRGQRGDVVCLWRGWRGYRITGCLGVLRRWFPCR
jgi:ADP-heptose:LPS heptosyltransferase